MLHVAIFLFFIGLVDFLFAINNEVAEVVLSAVCLLAANYLILTSLPVIFKHCPYQTPLTPIFWHTLHIIAIVFLFPFTFSSLLRIKVAELWRHVKQGFDCYRISAMEGKKDLDKDAVRLTLSLCRDDSEIEAFLEAVPDYLQIDDDDDVGARFDDIGSLLKREGVVLPLGLRMVQLLSSCIHGEGKMEDAARRHRALTCSHAVLELAKAVLSPTIKRLTLDLPKVIGHQLQHLSHDHDFKIAFAAARTAAVLERALLDQLSDTDDITNPTLSAETVEVLSETIGENDPTSPRFLAGPLSDDSVDRSDGRLIAVTEFISNILALLGRSWHPTRQDIEDIKSTSEELCRDLNGRDFSPATQERFVDVLCDTWQAHLASASTGTLSPQFSLESWLT
jgi:hypothetical protein